jgi:hypothetical protein
VQDEIKILPMSTWLVVSELLDEYEVAIKQNMELEATIHRLTKGE